MSAELQDSTLLCDQSLIDGVWCDARSGLAFDVKNPASSEVLAQVPDMGAVDARTAVEAAAAAFKDWRRRSARERMAILRRWHQQIIDNADDLALLLTLEQGKPLAEARAEVLSGANFVDWFAAEAMRVMGDILPPADNSRREWSTRHPIGVVAAITPWNFPSSMVTRKVAPALAAGCTVVLKPAEDTPLSALALAVLAERAGVPAGVFNVVTASHGAEVGGELTSNPQVRKLSFTGSTAVGKLLMAQCAATVKKVSLELGGNAPFLVFEDADLDEAVRGAIAIKFYNTGQTCICANRIMVHERVYDAFLERLARAVGALTLGEGTGDGVTQGPLINPAAFAKVSSLVEDAVSSGATVVTGGGGDAGLGGTFYPLTVLGDVTPAMKVFNTEIFGPVAPVYRFSDEDEAIRLANDTPYGLAAYAYTRDLGRIFRLNEQLEYGMVGVNTSRFVSETVPFGGVKESGIGREGSVYGIDEFLETRYLCLAGL
ncbi:Succinate-semialdehyde dehydrogenase [NADP+] (Ssdh) [Alloalcanivorax dieselolei B5]|uniref:Succinate-semialdehyde dehydrogenase [NADP+] (Ssdh) n=1 Tax=Alcanivorax dieselolei (strain DSM 16502 / CGMCC 1.3690 / MCCC 1A00001 / B-5) TaxID=930169 RepID=K0CGF0_ALCDB|nr:NAD-dependent succinate-semialdehyde dehydrogenase [Alloalcanivorax dieselolei]AFT70752.1 Succinate-semialdehyde dehydrogenase [NADP+] (Ssdh) [Alloalcanivorax dieselolei B5]GGJ97498.1 NAD-dependent succinate-semialdehyde dehydrogenase [Alloalcanivorax dieselolei]